ncbi:MAG: hypothetical protein ACTS73_08190 [Arsenophonus sp. NEOnobi-MAG3]
MASGVSKTHCGEGLAKQARVLAKCLTVISDKIMMPQARIIDTTSFNAMGCIMALEENGVTIDKGNIFVIGRASGCVASIKIQFFDKLAYSITAVIDQDSKMDYLKIFDS